MTGSARTFLFLQGPPGPFFAELAGRLAAAGHRCLRVNFNGGDKLAWSGPAADFRGRADEWPRCFEHMVRSKQITDVVLYGDCRSLHRAAIRLAQPLGVRIHVFEEGYIRPDWVTLERDGVNGFSRLPRDPSAYLSLAEGLDPIPDYPPIPSSFRHRAREALVYFAGSWLLTWRFPQYRSHRPYSVVAELGGWLRKLAASPLARRRSARALRQLGTARYFLLPLQLDSDHQIRTHSPFANIQEAIEHILVSFASHAPADARLLVKEHPLDNGLNLWRSRVQSLASRLDIAGRVHFIEQGDLYSLVAASAGLVTVNSTTGTLALASGIPVIVLGQAIYDLPGVTHQQGLNAFWTTPDRPQLEIYDAFRRTLVTRCLLRGGFSSHVGRIHLLPFAAERLTTDQPIPYHYGPETAVGATA